ncbi:MAG TPA: 30S ribosomal protein S3 [Candidatus Paceibacterota bacterium]|jgi:small subunit ribosomal protein S3|nr:30S ribosomal protein S3 [Candidatus Paceibacterota bacterium]
MGQKINPNSYRLGVSKNWPVRWFIKGGYAKFLEEDEAIRKTIMKKIGLAGVSGIEIERTQGNLRVFIKAARPGLVIGRGGKGVEDLNKAIADAVRKVRKTKSPIPMSVNVEELKRSEIAAPYVAQQIAWDLEKRMPFRRTMKKYIEQVVQNKEVKGVKIFLSGRLDGNEIARREHLSRGSLPLQTLRADIDYAKATAFTTYGTIGIRVWIYKGEIFEMDTREEERRAAQGGRIPAGRAPMPHPGRKL